MNAGNIRSAVIAGAIAFVIWVIMDSLFDDRSFGWTVISGILIGVATLAVTLAITIVISGRHQQRDIS